MPLPIIGKALGLGGEERGRAVTVVPGLGLGSIGSVSTCAQSPC